MRIDLALLLTAWVLGYKHRGILRVVKFPPASAGALNWRREQVDLVTARIERAMMKSYKNCFNGTSQPLLRFGHQLRLVTFP
jgi:hypothetical protein